MAEPTTKRNYKKTLNLPRTAFPMKANLVQNEPASIKRWDGIDVYQQLRRRPHPRGRYVFHDGPPYANGSIHLGHLLNKVLKDLVVRSKTMLGYDAPYVPGWDCHGLPIEHKVLAEGAQGPRGVSGGGAEGRQSEEERQAETIKIRRKSKAYAEKFVKLQAQQMRRLLTTADYENPYLTMNPGYEAAVLGVFGELVEKGLVYRGLKPVHWSIDNQTALADAELEYHDREDTSVYVLFEIDQASPLQRAGGNAGDAPTYLMIWTTTPWTLPANLAVAVSPAAEYGLFDVGGKKIWIACDLASRVLASEGVEPPTPGTVCRGEDLVGLTYRHPFVNDDKQRRVVAADYVTLEDGTGLVHTAPGHGVEDYQTGLRENLDIYCPVRGDGTFDDTAPDWLHGKSVWDANALVCDKLADSGHLFHREPFNHSYPHDWRSKTPVIFRATEQWFVAVDEAPSSGAPHATEAPHANAGPPASPSA
ncbi:MAG: class I tRNA ligase family protein, partial [Phycisphaeraceae bacterium]